MRGGRKVGWKEGRVGEKTEGRTKGRKEIVQVCWRGVC